MAYLDLTGGGRSPSSIASPGLRAPHLTPVPHVQAVDLATRPAPLKAPFPSVDYSELDVALDAANGALWCHMRPSGPPSFTPNMLSELIALRRTIQAYASVPNKETALRWFVGASRLPGIYNLGGDLGYFVQSIRMRDRERLRAYAFDCCNVGYHMAVGFDTPIVTVALVQGDALGGGFEGALSFQVLVAERSARMGLPEVLFNLFPGMGAYSFLARKIGGAMAGRMIMSGKIYTAAELYELGVVDILAEDGKGEEEVRRLVSSSAARHRLHHAMGRVARRYQPITLEEMCDITDIWVETAMQLDEADLRKMERLALAQRRRLAKS